MTTTTEIPEVVHTIDPKYIKDMYYEESKPWIRTVTTEIKGTELWPDNLVEGVDYLETAIYPQTRLGDIFSGTDISAGNLPDSILVTYDGTKYNLPRWGGDNSRGFGYDFTHYNFNNDVSGVTFDYPLCLVCLDGKYDNWFIGTTEEGEHTIEISLLGSETLHTIDNKYLNFIDTFAQWLLVDIDVDDYDSGDYPSCTFVIGAKYAIFWNGTLYENIECILYDGYRTLGNPEELPFHINDDGGAGLYIEVTDDDGIFESVAIFQLSVIDPGYIPYVYNKFEIDAIMGSYITDINALIGGDE